MKRGLLIGVCMLGMIVSGVETTVFGLLRNFREGMVHNPGAGGFKDGLTSLAAGGGTALELTLAFGTQLAKAGIEHEMVSGHVSMSTEQLAFWLPLVSCGEEIGAIMGQDGRWSVPLTWLRCRTSYGPRLQGGSVDGLEWVDVFPALVGSEQLSGSGAAMAQSSLNLLRSYGYELHCTPEGVLDGADVLFRTSREAAGVLLEEEVARFHVGHVLEPGGPMPGYRSRQIQNLRPVRILDMCMDGGEEPSYVMFDMRTSDGTELVSARRLDAHEDGILEISWHDGAETWDAWTAQAGDVLSGRRLAALVRGACGEVRSESGVSAGDAVTLRFSLLRAGNCLETIEDIVRAGDRCVVALSCGYAGPAPSRVQASEGRLRWLARHLRSRLDYVRRMSEGIFGERCGNQLYGYKVVLSMESDASSRVSGRSLSGGPCQHWLAGEGLGLSLLLSGQCVTAELFEQVTGGAVDSSLGQLSDSMSADGRVIAESDGVLRFGRSDVQLEVDGERRFVESPWRCSGGQMLSGRVVKAFWCMRDEELREFPEWELAALIGAVNELRQQPGWASSLAWRLAATGVLAEWESRNARRSLVKSIHVSQQTDATGRARAVLAFSLADICSWEAGLFDADGVCVASWTGNEADVSLTWNGMTMEGMDCGNGDYAFRLLVDADGVTLAESRRLTWDVTPPQVTASSQGVVRGGVRLARVEYSAEDENLREVGLCVLDARNRRELTRVVAEEAHGVLEIPLGEFAGDVFIVEVTGRDASGNVGRAEGQVLFGTFFVDGRVVASGERTEEETIGLAVELSFPSTDSAVDEGVMPVIGTVRSDGGLVRYQLRIRDSAGSLMDCKAEDADGPWRLSFWKSERAETDIEWTYPSREGHVEGGELARVDLTGLRSGAYQLELVGIGVKTHCSRRVPFFFDNTVPVGEVSYSETDGKVKVGQIALALSRRYSSLEPGGAVGAGWSFSLDTFGCETYDERSERENLWGDRVSLRTGGRRDITLTLPDGRRTTFVFSLEPGGGMSFSYIGSWRAVTDVPWRLRATVDSNVTALPGLEPYWNFAGVSVPLDMVDFPGYILEGEDGNRYQFTCEHLGDYEAVNEDGGSVMVTCYGKPVLSSVHFKDGRVMELTSEALVWHEPDGTSSQALAFSRDNEKRIEQIMFMDGSGTVLRYRYDGQGNLSEMLKGTDWAEPTVRRRYLYEDRNFPHLLTKVLNGSGMQLAFFACDEQGRLAEFGGAEGSGAGVRHSPFSRTEILEDAQGNETVMTYDRQGNVLEMRYADGGVLRFSYDEAGRRVKRTDETGAVTRWQYDDAGRLTARTDALGGVTEYGYDSSGECCRMTDVLGRTLEKTVSDNGRIQTFSLPSGAEVTVETDDEGQVRAMSGTTVSSQRLSLWRSEDGHSSRVEDEEGVGITTEVTTDGHVKTTEHSWLDENNELVTARSEATLDSEGRLLYLCDSFGNSEEIQRNEDGLVTAKYEETGRWVHYRYDVSGRRVQSRTSEGYVTRMVYDGSGKVLLMAGPEALPDTDGTLVFSCGTLLEYDARGRCCAERLVEAPAVAMAAQGGGRYGTALLQCGKVLGEATRDYDRCGRPIRETSLTGEEKRYGYDALGRMTFHEDGKGNRTSFTHDALGNLLCQTDALGNQTQWTYDADGYVTGRLDPDGRRMSTEFGAGGRLLRYAEDGAAPIVIQRNAYGHAVSSVQGAMAFRLEHDAYGGLVSVTDALGHGRTFERDIQGRVVKQTSAEGRVLAWRYDNCLGETLTFDGGDGQRVECELDSRGRWKSRRIMSGEECLRRVVRNGDDDLCVEEAGCITWEEALERDATGRLVARVIDQAVESRYVYDAPGRVVGYESPVTAVSFGYGEDGRLCCLSYSRADGLELSEPLTISCEYDELGRIVRETCSGKWEREVAFDAMGRITSERLSEAGQPVRDIVHVYDSGGRRSRSTERCGEDVLEKSWEYDELGQLVAERQEENGGMVYEWSGSYDAAGNLVTERTWADGVQERAVHRFDRDDCLIESRYSGDRGSYTVSYAWNNLGQLVSEECSGSQRWSIVYSWSADGRLLSCEQQGGSRTSRVSFSYDGHGLLNGHVRQDLEDGTVREVTHRFHYERHIHGDEAQIMDYTVEASGSRVSRTVLPVYGRYFHDAWGEMCGDSASGMGAFDEWQEASTGLVYLRSRFYSPRLRRFISADLYPADETQPRSFNRFSYCMNDPVNRRDPHGTMSGMLTSMGIMAKLQTAMTFLKSNALMLTMIYKELVLINDTYNASYVINSFAEQEHVKDNATIFVHGMGYHDENWADDMIGELGKAGVDNQDYYVHLWSGFALTPCIFIPIPSLCVHTLAKISLMCGISLVQLKWYENINIICHSWGTVLSASVLDDVHSAVNTWVTMGSPLCRRKPTFFCRNWLNCVNDDDPVTYAAPVLFAMGYLHCPVPLRTQSDGPWQLKTYDKDDLHSCYWTNPDVVRSVRDFLNRR